MVKWNKRQVILQEKTIELLVEHGQIPEDWFASRKQT